MLQDVPDGNVEIVLEHFIDGMVIRRRGGSKVTELVMSYEL